jgi:hypothetical protein
MARKYARGGLMVRVYDRPLLRSSVRAHGAFCCETAFARYRLLCGCFSLFFQIVDFVIFCGETVILLSFS